MANYGDLSKAQRQLLDDLWGDGSQAKRAVSLKTAVSVEGKRRQTARNLSLLGLVVIDRKDGSWAYRVWLSDAGQAARRSVAYHRREIPWSAR